jgi:hypothetical protein
LDDAEILGNEFVGAEIVFDHVLIAVGAMLRKMSATDNATVIAANPAADKINTFTSVAASTQGLALFLKRQKPRISNETPQLVFRFKAHRSR